MNKRQNIQEISALLGANFCAVYALIRGGEPGRMQV